MTPRPPKATHTGPQQPRLQDIVRLSADGVAKVLGDLEARVLQAVWSLDKPVPARAVYERVAKHHRVSPLTVITVLNKLVVKKILVRERLAVAHQGQLLHYRAALSEPEFRALVSRRMMEGILSFGPNAMAASLVDVLAEQNPEHLAALGRLVRRKIKDAERGGK